MMKNILFIVNAGKISPNENGGSSVYFSHLELLNKAGYNVTLLLVEWDETNSYHLNDYVEVSSFVKEIIQFKAIIQRPTKGLKRLMNAIFFPELFEYYFLNAKNKQALEKVVTNNSIDLVWAEWRWAGLLAWYSKLKLPLVYAHHDWEYKLAKLRTKSNVLKKFHTYQKKRVEFRLVRGATACISGSVTEAKEIDKISKKSTLYLPTTYKSIKLDLSANEIPNIVHLGGMETTANRLGLERFLDVCWADIKKSKPNVKLLVIGSLEKAPETLLEKLNDTNITCLGFVKDLSSVLHPHDIHIIPWEYNTGTRTRLPLVLNYEQVLVATKESVKAFPEINDKENSILCNTLNEMTLNILNLIQNPNRIKELSKAGKETFFNKFTVDSQLNRIKNFIDTI